MQELESLDPSPYYKILTPDHLEPSFESERVSRISSDDLREFANLVGRDDTGNPRGFIIIDGQAVLIQDKHTPTLAEVVEEENRVAAIQKAYNAVSQAATE